MSITSKASRFTSEQLLLRLATLSARVEGHSALLAEQRAFSPAKQELLSACRRTFEAYGNDLINIRWRLRIGETTVQKAIVELKGAGARQHLRNGGYDRLLRFGKPFFNEMHAFARDARAFLEKILG